MPSSEEQAPDASFLHAEQKYRDPISIEVPLVDVDVLVTDQDGRVLSGLERQNFRILDNGKPQVITHFEPPDAEPITIAVADGVQRNGLQPFCLQSSFLGIELSRSPRTAGLGGTRHLDIQPTVRLDFTRNKAAMQQALSSLSYPQFREANMYDAITDTLDRLDRVKGNKAILLISTGANTMSASTLDDTLKRVKQSAVTIFSVGLAEAEHQWVDARSSGGRSIRYLQAKNELQTFARLSGGNAWFPRFEGEVPSILKSVTAFLGSQYNIGFSPDHLKPDGKYHKLKVEIVQQDGTPPHLSVSQIFLSRSHVSTCLCVVRE